MEVARLELLHEHSVAQPHFLFICPSLFVDSNVRLVLASCFGVGWNSQITTRAFCSPASHSICSSKLVCRLECETGIGKLFWGERL